MIEVVISKILRYYNFNIQFIHISYKINKLINHDINIQFIHIYHEINHNITYSTDEITIRYIFLVFA